MLPLLLLASAAASTPAAELPNDYRNPATWLCRPGRADACAGDMATTTVTPDGKTSIQPNRPRRVAPKTDCFYAYPTTSMDALPHSDMNADRAERGMAAAQLGVLRDVCRTFAPIYRQVTLPALRSAMGKGTRIPDSAFDLPYADIRAAFRDYLARDHHGRPFVLIGHSQGSAMLKRLLIEEIDGKPLQRRLLSAILPGVSVMVPPGRDVGGDLKSVPLCRAETQTGCVVTWASYRDTNPAPPNALFGRAPLIGKAAAAGVAGCTNPARLEGGAAPLDPILGFPWWKGGVARFERPEAWTAKGKPLKTRFVRAPGLLSGDCVTRNGFRYLAVRVTPGAARDLDDVAVGPDAIGAAAWPDWGFHVVDLAIVAGDLRRLVAHQRSAWRQRR